jgi:alkaline phosphatase
MLSKTLELFGDDQFFLVVEEEGSDNFGNVNNAVGVLEALRRADAACGVALDYLEKHPKTLIITAADSEAGNMDVIGLGNTPEAIAAALVGHDLNGAPYGLDLNGKPFLAEPDRFGQRLRFVVSWGTQHDSSGGILVRAAGAGAEAVRGTMDNTSIYRVMRSVLFGATQE